MRFKAVLMIIIFCFTFFNSCFSTSRSKGNILFANITDKTKFYLLPPVNIEREMDMAQYITAEYGSQKFFMMSWIKADNNGIEMVFFNEFGAGIGELLYKDNAINFSSSVIPRAALRRFKPEFIIADFQLCFYDPVVLKEVLKNIGLIFEIQKDGNNENRRILNGNDVIIEITKMDKSVELVNLLRRYSFTFEGDFN